MNVNNTSTIFIKAFQTLIWEYYKNNRRDMPWRQSEPDGEYDPYKIMLSEIMLQQTQVARVIPKYLAFLKQFPNIRSLAEADLGSVLQAWAGLGYNRRAKYLWESARILLANFNAQLPLSMEELVSLPGVGRNTAAAILAYAHDERVVFLETNIRTILIHHFFTDQQDVTDVELRGLMTQLLPNNGYRDWYYALMDYGSHLKVHVGNKSRQAKIYTKQVPFKGSIRQTRGLVLRALGTAPQSLVELSAGIGDERLSHICEQLISEGIIHEHKQYYFLG